MCAAAIPTRLFVRRPEIGENNQQQCKNMRRNDARSAVSYRKAV